MGLRRIFQTIFDREIRMKSGKLGGKAFAAMAVILMVCVAFASLQAGTDASEAQDRNSTIYMMTGDSFIYQPTSNLTGTTFTFLGSAVSAANGGSFGTGLEDNGCAHAKFRFEPTSAGMFEAIIQANNGIASLSSIQTIKFVVTEPLEFGNIEDLGVEPI